MVTKWHGAKYTRIGKGNLRDANTGAVYSRDGRLLGYEPRRKNFYGDDKKYKKGPKRPNLKRR